MSKFSYISGTQPLGPTSHMNGKGLVSGLDQTLQTRIGLQGLTPPLVQPHALRSGTHTASTWPHTPGLGPTLPCMPYLVHRATAFKAPHIPMESPAGQKTWHQAPDLCTGQELSTSDLCCFQLSSVHPLRKWLMFSSVFSAL